MDVLITLTAAGADLGPFSIYTNVDGYTTPIETGISRAALLAGYTSTLVPAGATGIRLESTGSCTNTLDLTITVVTTYTGDCVTVTVDDVDLTSGVDDLYICYTPVGGSEQCISYTALKACLSGSGTSQFILCLEPGNHQADVTFKYGPSGSFQNINSAVIASTPLTCSEVIPCECV